MEGYARILLIVVADDAMIRELKIAGNFIFNLSLDLARAGLFAAEESNYLLSQREQRSLPVPSPLLALLPGIKVIVCDKIVCMSEKRYIGVKVASDSGDVAQILERAISFGK